MLYHCFLASTVSYEKSAVNLIVDPLYVLSVLLAITKFSLFLTFNSLIIICVGFFKFILYIYIFKLLGFLAFYHSSNLINFGCYLFRYFLCFFVSLLFSVPAPIFFWDTYNVYIVPLDAPQVSIPLQDFSSFFFAFCSSEIILFFLLPIQIYIKLL